MTPSSPEADREGVASLETLGRSECLNLLATAQVGRVALVVDGHPEILPVNYALDGDAVLFRTAEGSVLTHAALARWRSRSTTSTRRPAADGASSSKDTRTTSAMPSTRPRSGCADCQSSPGRQAAGTAGS
jgi:hypothetical protein